MCQNWVVIMRYRPCSGILLTSIEETPAGIFCSMLRLYNDELISVWCTYTYIQPPFIQRDRRRSLPISKKRTTVATLDKHGLYIGIKGLWSGIAYLWVWNSSHFTCDVLIHSKSLCFFSKRPWTRPGNSTRPRWVEHSVFFTVPICVVTYMPFIRIVRYYSWEMYSVPRPFFIKR